MNVPNALLAAGLQITDLVLGLYIWILIAGAIMSWLVAFGIINMRNRFVQMASDFVYRVTEPLLRPIRNILPPMGGLDLSPLVLIFIIIFLQRFIAHLAF